MTSRRRRFCYALAGLALVPLAWLLYSWYVTDAALRQAEAEAALDLPRWRLLEMEADRGSIPDVENSAVHMFATLLKGGKSHFASTKYLAAFPKPPPVPAQLNGAQIALLRSEFAKIGPALTDARKIKDMPRGRIAIAWNDDFISTTVASHQDVREIAVWLEHDAWLLAQDGDVERAMDSCQAIIMASRVFDGDVFLLSHLIQLGVQYLGATSLERVLAQGVASDAKLHTLQKALADVVHDQGWLAAARGERAGNHHLFQNISNGKVTSIPFSLAVPNKGRRGAVTTLASWLGQASPSILLQYYPEHLRMMNRLVDIAKLPVHERQAKAVEWEADCTSSGNPVVWGLAPKIAVIARIDAGRQALFRSALAALACERYRLRHKNWPASLDVLVNDKLLEAIPIDPFDNQPLRLVRTADGVVVYSIGPDLKDHNGLIDREQVKNVDIGFRLWNTDRRRQPPQAPDQTTSDDK